MLTLVTREHVELQKNSAQAHLNFGTRNFSITRQNSKSKREKAKPSQVANRTNFQRNNQNFSRGKWTYSELACCMSASSTFNESLNDFPMDSMHMPQQHPSTKPQKPQFINSVIYLFLYSFRRQGGNEGKRELCS